MGTGVRPTTPAATATVPSARRPRGRRGSMRAARNCCPCPTSTWSSPCRTSLAPLALQNKQVALRPALPRGRRDLAGGCRHSQAPRGRDRLPGRAAHLGPEPAGPSAPALRGARRRALPGRLPLDRLPQARISSCRSRSSARSSAGSSSTTCKRAFAEGKLRFHGRLAELAQPEAFQRLLSAVLRQEVGGLRQAALRRPGAGARSTWPATPTAWPSPTGG